MFGSFEDDRFGARIAPGIHDGANAIGYAGASIGQEPFASHESLTTFGGRGRHRGDQPARQFDVAPRPGTVADAGRLQAFEVLARNGGLPKPGRRDEDQDFRASALQPRENSLPADFKGSGDVPYWHPIAHFLRRAP